MTTLFNSNNNSLKINSLKINGLKINDLKINDPKVIVALDYNNQTEALTFVDRLDPTLCRLKVGKELFTRLGPQFVDLLQKKGFDVFLDLKFYDIPNTVAKAVQAAADLGVWMVDVHASGGERMLHAASEVLTPYGADRPLLIAITVLTSFTETEMQALGLSISLEEQVLHLAKIAKNSGCDGVVCSAHEAPTLKKILGSSFKLITPGIRLNNEINDDQRRIMTPYDAIQAGSDYLVIGRAITQSSDPLALLKKINQQLQV